MPLTVEEVSLWIFSRLGFCLRSACFPYLLVSHHSFEIHAYTYNAV